MSTVSPDEYRARAHAAEQSGEPDKAERIYDTALREWPGDAALWNSAGNSFMRHNKKREAATRFTQAMALDGSSIEYAINTAIALAGDGRSHDALEQLRARETQGRGNARYCSVRASTARTAGQLGEAADWYDRLLALDPVHAKGLHGRARVALERGEDRASDRFDRALDISGASAELWLGKAQALDAEGQLPAATEIAQALADQLPQWVEGLRLLSQLRLAGGDADFIAPYRIAAERAPQESAIPIAHCAVLAGQDRFDQAAEVAAEARKRFPDDPGFALLEAIHAGEAGQNARADAIFQGLALTTPGRYLHEARHRIRLSEAERADALLKNVLAVEPANITAWALRGIAWRLIGDARSDWLHEQAGLVQLLPLHDADTVLPAAIDVLHQLHDGSAFPLGQSLRGGTQTRGGLFDRVESELRKLHRAITATLEDYRAGLPQLDASHPLLCHRNAYWRVVGSWSVRLTHGGDHHQSHIHPKGVISSALYLQLPSDLEQDGVHGALEIGRPPPDLALDLEPLAVIRPRYGHLALFPSTQFHGTTPFATGQRMTVAFDVGVGHGPIP